MVGGMTPVRTVCTQKMLSRAPAAPRACPIAPFVLLAGVACVVAASFARIFFRNAIDTALPILECPAAAAGIRAGDEVRIDLATGTIEDLTTGAAYQADPFPPFMRGIVAAGGLAAWAANRAREPEEAE